MPFLDGAMSKATTCLDSLVSLVSAHTLLDSYMLKTAGTRMIDGAIYWYQTSAAEIHTWGDLSQATFMKKDDGKNWNEKLECRLLFSRG